jgi:DNA polymerase-1
LDVLCGNPRLRYAAHNAKFELAFLRHQFGVEVRGRIWDTEVFARTERNDHLKYGLQACAERIGESKYPPFLEWRKKNKKLGYDKAPPELIEPYVEQDARLSRILMEKQIATFTVWQTATPVPIIGLTKVEQATTPELFEMEYHGVYVDRRYAEEGLVYEHERAKKAATEFERLSGVPFVDSRKTLEPVFVKAGLPFGITEKGNPSFTADALKPSLNHPIAKAVIAYREALKRASSYWYNLIQDSIPTTDPGVGIMHPDIKQTGATTFRMSIVDPACQTWPDDSEDPDCKYPIRRAVLPDPGDVIVSIDYAQMELRKIIDEAEETAMANDIMTGADFHQRVAETAGVKRSLAKNGRFAKLYGAGVPKIASTLGISEALAQKISDTIDEQSPRIVSYSRALVKDAQRRGYGYNWLGRRYFFSKKFDPESGRMKSFEYKMPNYRIQGGCGEILRLAIISCGPIVRAVGGRILLPIHDELVFSIPRDQLHVIPLLKAAMIAAQKDKRILAMDVSVAVGPNLHDLEEWKETNEETRNEVQGTSSVRSREAPEHLGAQNAGA